MTTEAANPDLDPRAVRGHICDGLREHRDAATYVCIPRIEGDGRLAGCDADNPVLIRFCPFCGERLPEPKGTPER